MIGAKKGAGFFLLSVMALPGCASPVGQREAVQIATARLNKYCGESPGCRPMHFTAAQKIKGRWLIEFDTPANQFAVAVGEDGNSEVSIWDKSRDAAGQ